MGLGTFVPLTHFRARVLHTTPLTVTVQQASARTPWWHTLCLGFSSPLTNLTFSSFTTALMSLFLSVCYSVKNLSTLGFLRKDQALALHCNCKDNLIKHPFLTSKSFLRPHPVLPSWLQLNLPVFILTTVILDQPRRLEGKYVSHLSQILKDTEEWAQSWSGLNLWKHNCNYEFFI